MEAQGQGAGDRVLINFLDFLETYEDQESVDENGRPVKEYVRQLESMKTYGKTTIFVSVTHVMDTNDPLASAILEEYYRFEPYLRKAVQQFVHRHHPDYVMDEGQSKEFYVSFYNHRVLSKLRAMKVEEIGRLSSVSGVVTRTSEVRPELLYGTFKCLECGQVHRDVEQQFKYTEPIICANSTCANREKWALERHASKFVDWQRLRLQESTDEVPAGSLPRSLDVILRHEIVEQARAGDKCIFTGCLIVVPDVGALARSGERREAVRNGEGGGQRSGAGGGAASGDGVRGLKALGVRDLSYRMVFLATSVQSLDKEKQLVNIRAEEDEDTSTDMFTEEEREEIERMKEGGGNVYDRLTESIAPAVYGHHDVKRAILLMLFGGCHKRTHEGINLRGDINVCIVGDPSCAKSQFLKYVANFLPRAVYTSGKSSSAAGLTASVVKEPETGEFCIEAGALMLADNGICCIDEFDKMDIKDQVAIHEAMEQQTISIAKAGIQATLNARTSILAAANPTAGRYDRSKPLKYNVALPPAILSRFDLVHVMVDSPDAVADASIARHIVTVHQKKDRAVSPPFTTLQLQKYIKFARTIKPKLSDAARAKLVESYVALRRGDAQPGSRTAYRITVRQLEALVRLSEALARVYCKHEVEVSHVEEAKSLLGTSIISVDSHDVELDNDDDAPDDIDYRNMPVPGGGNGAAHEANGRHGGDGNDDDEDMDGPDGPDAPGAGSAAPGHGGSPGAGAGAGANGAPGGTGRGRGNGQGGAAHEGGEGRDGEIAGHSGAGGGGGGGAEALGEPAEEEAAAEKEEGTRRAAGGERAKVQVSYDKLQQVTQALVAYLRQRENSSDPDASGGGMKQGDLVRWYVAQQNSQGLFDSIDEVVQEYRLVRSIIQHLIKREAVLLVLDDGATAVEAARRAAEEARAQAEAEGRPLPAEQPLPSAVEERVLAVNPNFVQE